MGGDLYAVMGLQKQCTSSDLKTAYKKLAMRWHPDRCSASGNSKFVEEANNKFQLIQEAYSVLSDETKRHLYDVGVYDNDDDENNDGMGDFLKEMVAMMTETKPSENGEASFEELQELFEEMLQTDVVDPFSSTTSQGPTPSHSSYARSFGNSCTNNNYKRSCSEMNHGEEPASFNAHFQNFCVGVEREKLKEELIKGKGKTERGVSSKSSYSKSRRRQGRKQKVPSFAPHLSSNDYTGVLT